MGEKLTKTTTMVVDRNRVTGGFSDNFLAPFLPVFAAASERDNWVENQTTSGGYLVHLLAETGG